jgi:hypothetical protein
MKPPRNMNTLDALEEEDREVLGIVASIDANRGQSIEQRSRYGDLVKRLTRQLGLREAAEVGVLRGLTGQPSLTGVAEKMTANMEARRQHIDRVERMSRGVQGMSLNTGQDFDAELVRLSAILSDQVQWELNDAIPAIRSRLSASEQAELFETARRVRRRAPTNLHPEGPRWHERAPVIAWLLTKFDHLRDYPTAAKRAG